MYAIKQAVFACPSMMLSELPAHSRSSYAFATSVFGVILDIERRAVYNCAGYERLIFWSTVRWQGSWRFFIK